VIAYTSVLDCVDATATATSGLAVAAGTLVTGLAAVEIFIPDINGQAALISAIHRLRTPVEGDWEHVFHQAQRDMNTSIS